MNASRETPAQAAAAVLHIAFPLVTIVLFASLPILRVLTQGPSARATYRISLRHKRWLVVLSPLVVFTFVCRYFMWPMTVVANGCLDLASCREFVYARCQNRRGCSE